MLLPLLAALVSACASSDASPGIRNSEGWIGPGHGIEQESVWLMAVAPSDPRVVYVELIDGNFRKSTDGGNSWFNPAGTNPAIFPGFIFPPSLAVSPASAEIVLAADWRPDPEWGPITLRTTDGGATWNTVASDWVTAVAFDPADPQHLVAGFGDFQRESHLGESHDGCATWEIFPDDVLATALQFDPSSPGTLRAVLTDETLGGNFPTALYRSSDGGRTWQLIGPLPDDPVLYPAVAFDRTAPNTFFSATFSESGWGGLSRTSDGGLTWMPLAGTAGTQAFVGAWVPQVLLDPNDDLHIVVIARTIPEWQQFEWIGSIVETLDGGASWSDATPDVPPSEIGPLAFGNDGRLFASVRGSGVFWLAPRRGLGVRPPAKIAPAPISGRP